MGTTAVYLFETGLFQKLPGFSEGFPFSLLPFWGNYCLVDFMLANFAPAKGTEVSIVLDDSSRGLALALSTRWKKPSAKVHIIEEGHEGLVRILAGSGDDRVVLASLSFVCALDQPSLLALAGGAGEEVVKVSVGKTPIEMYCTRRDRLLALLGNGVARASMGSGIRKRLFDAALLHGIDLIVDVPGELLFQNDLMEYYRRNLWVAANGESEHYNRIISRLPELSDPWAESHVAEKGSIRDSYLASGVAIEGTVEGSIIFPNVNVRTNALVSRSVILNGNSIGAGTEIHNSLILPFTREISRSTPNIGDNCSIGAKTSSQRNADFPEQIRDGITVVGVDAEIPNGFQAEAGSCIGPGIPASLLRKMKVLRRGASVLASHGEAGGSPG